MKIFFPQTNIKTNPEIEIIGIDHAKMLPHVEKSDEFIEIVKPLLEK